jgi:hypothetical protein
MMSKNPRDRFADMAAAADALSKYLVESKTGTSPADQATDQSMWDVVPDDEPVLSPKRRRPIAPTVAAKKPAKRGQPSRKASRAWKFWTAVGFASLIAITAAVVLFLQTPEGTVRIAITDPEIQVRFAGQTFTFEDNGTEVEVTPGKHALFVKRGSLSFPTDEFTVEKNGETAIEVSWQDGELLATKGGELIGRGVEPAAVSGDAIGPDEIALVHRFEGHRASGAGGMALGVSADGRWMLSAGGDDRTARLWNLASRGSVLTLTGLESALAHVAISPDGKRGAGLCFEGQVVIWNLETGKVMHSMAHDDHAANAIAFSPSGRRLITGARKGVVIVWDVESGKEVARHDFGSYIRASRLLDDDHALVAVQEVFHWDLAGGEVETTWPTFGCDSIAVSGDGSTLVTSRWDGALQTWDRGNGEPIRRFSGHTQKVTSIAFLPNQRYLISGGADGRIIIWDRQTGREVARKEELGHLANTVLPLPDGRHAVSFGRWYDGKEPNPVEGDRDIRLWRLPESVWPKAAAE